MPCHLHTRVLWLAVLAHVLVPTSEQTTESAAKPRRPLPDDLPSLRWKQKASLLRCCAEDEALVRSAVPGDEPACRPVAAPLRWRPRLLNGRTKERAPPDRRTTLRTGNLSCEEGSFWLDGARPEQRFDLLTTGQLYLRAADALFPAVGFCADRLLDAGELEQREDAALGQTPAGDGDAVQVEAVRVCNISLHQASSLLDPDTLDPTCLRPHCVRKCCPRGLQVGPDLACIPQRAGHLWRPTFHADLTRPVPVDRYHIVPGNPLCPPSKAGKHGRVFELQPAYTDDELFYLQPDGALWVPEQDKLLGLAHFCVDQARYRYNATFEFDYPYAIACFGTPPPRVYAKYYVYQALLAVSACFLLVTFVVYAAIPELQNVHGRCLLSQVAALFTADLCILSAQTHTVYENMAFCQVTAIVMYYSFLAVCFWLNAMSFDIWWTFSRVHAPTAGASKTKRFIRYSLYCWLCPLLLTLVTVFMQYAPDNLVPPENFVRPGLGTLRCWFPGSWEMLVYLHGPLLVLMTANLVLFVLTALSLLRSEKDTQMVRKKKTGVERLKIYVNLFIVMGITWIAEALSVYLGRKYLWYVSDVINCLQGVLIFLLFTMRGRTRRIIRRHLDSWGICRWCRCCGSPASDGRPHALLSGKTRTTSLPTGTSTKRAQSEELAVVNPPPAE